MLAKYKVRVLLLMLFVFGLVLGCKNGGSDDKAAETPRVLPQFSSTSFENKVPDLVSYDPPASGSLILPDQKAVNKILASLPLVKAAVGQDSPARVEAEDCKFGEEWKKDKVKLKVMAQESASYANCNINVVNKAMADLTSKLIADGNMHGSNGEYYVYKTNIQDGDLLYNSLEIFSVAEFLTWHMVWSDQPKRLVFFFVAPGTSKTTGMKGVGVGYLEGFQQGDDLYLSSFERADYTLVKASEVVWEQAAYNSVSGVFRIIKGSRELLNEDLAESAVVVRGNVNKQIAGVRVYINAKGKQDATGALFGTFDAEGARTKLALTKDISETTLDVFDPEKFYYGYGNYSQGTLKSNSELRRVVLERFKALKALPAMKGSFYE